MRESKDFIIEKLNNLFVSIKGIKIRYEYRAYMSTHFIEILPLDTFEKNQEYILIEMEIQDKFEEIYGKKEDILFISSESLNEIREEQYSLGHEEIIKTITIPPALKHVFASEFANIILTEQNTSYQLAA